MQLQSSERCKQLHFLQIQELLQSPDTAGVYVFSWILSHQLRPKSLFKKRHTKINPSQKFTVASIAFNKSYVASHVSNHKSSRSSTQKTLKPIFSCVCFVEFFLQVTVVSEMSMVPPKRSKDSASLANSWASCFHVPSEPSK